MRTNRINRDGMLALFIKLLYPSHSAFLSLLN